MNTLNTFKFGDIVVGNASAHYTMTSEGTEWVVVGFQRSNKIHVIAPETFQKLIEKGVIEIRADKLPDNFFISRHGALYTVLTDRFDFVRPFYGASNRQKKMF